MTDSGRVHTITRVTPLFILCGPRTRGAFATQRQNRARRSDARPSRRPATAELVIEPVTVERSVVLPSFRRC
ncbi:hypothetical protein DB354_19880 [Opitutus sp. ER46]|nr:hypothetical protein DB354_19880 [Opitutus sp. ER46]